MNSEQLELAQITPTLEQQIALLQRAPFREALASALRIKPTTDALQKFADKAPDRFWQMVTMIAKLSGYSDPKLVNLTENNFYLNLQSVSDSQLEQMLAESLQKLEERRALPVKAENVTDA